MRSELTSTSRLSIRYWRSAVVGALLGVMLGLLGWVSAAARILPSGAVEWLRRFEPHAEGERFFISLLWFSLGGAVVVVAFAWLSEILDADQRRRRDQRAGKSPPR